MPFDQSCLVALNHLSHTQVAQIVTGVTDGKTLPQEVLAQIVEKTDGVPLFVEEMTKAILESGQLKALNGHYALTGSFSAFVAHARGRTPAASASSSLNFGVESFQFHAGIFNAELPVDPALFRIRLVRPGCNFSLQFG